MSKERPLTRLVKDFDWTRFNDNRVVLKLECWHEEVVQMTMTELRHARRRKGGFFVFCNQCASIPSAPGARPAKEIR